MKMREFVPQAARRYQELVVVWHNNDDDDEDDDQGREAITTRLSYGTCVGG